MQELRFIVVTTGIEFHPADSWSVDGAFQRPDFNNALLMYCMLNLSKTVLKRVSAAIGERKGYQ